MADDDTQDSTTQQDGAATAPQQPDDLGDAGKKALAAERAGKKAAEKQLAELTKRLAEFEDRDKTEAQKLVERAEAAERELSQTRTDAMRARVALSKGVPASLADRLRGDDEAAMAEDADRLLDLLKPAAPGRPAGNVDQGVRGGGSAPGVLPSGKPDMNALIRAAARGGDPL